MTLDTLGDVSDTRYTNLVVYVGDSLATLLPVTRGLSSYTKNYQLTFPVEGGRSYQIVSAGSVSSNGAYGQTGFNLHFTKTTLPPPVVGRDNFADRAPLKGSEAMAVANNEQASIETDEPDHTPGQKDARTVWWTWTAPAKGRVAIDTLKNVSGTQSTALAVYTGDALAGLTSVAQKSAPTLNYALAFPVKAGTAYQIAANGADGGSVGQIGFNLHFHPALPEPPAKTTPKAKPKHRPAG